MRRVRALLGVLARKLSSTGQNPCGPLAGNRDRDRRPCEGISNASATRPVASARTASRHSRDAVVRSGSTATLGCAGFAIVDRLWMRGSGESHTAKSGCATRNGAANARYALRKAPAAIDGAPGSLCYDFLQSWPSREVRPRDSRGQAQHTDDGRRSIHTFLPCDSFSFRLDWNSERRAFCDTGRFREGTCPENCGGVAGRGKCVLRNSQCLILATWRGRPDRTDSQG